MMREKPGFRCAIIGLALGLLAIPMMAAAEPRSGIDSRGFDRDVRAVDDFYGHNAGAWLAETTIPEDQSTYGAFGILRRDSDGRLRDIIEQIAVMESIAPGSDEQIIRDFHLAFMDTARADALGISPLRSELERIDAIDGLEGIAAYMGYAQGIGVAMPYRIYVWIDYGDPDSYVVYLTQDGLGLPDREYYLKKDERASALREAYSEYIGTLFRLAGLAESTSAIADVLALETRIAERQWTREQDRQRDATYNPLAREALDTLLSGFPLQAYLEAAGIADQASFVLRQPDYFVALAQSFPEVPVETWKNYLRAQLLASAAPYLSDAFVQADFRFNGETISGLEKMRPRWRRAVQNADAAIGELLGRQYVKRHFSAVAKTRMDALVANLLEAFRQSIDRLDWMGEATKAEARAKLSQIRTKIGFPEVWRDYSGLEIRPDDLLGNILRAARFDYERDIGRLGGPVDHSEWGITPQTVNAYYSPTLNEIVFPAAILQPPFFDPQADDAVNYGAIGGVIGHEISHAFDDQGRKTDGTGRLRDWWTQADTREFAARADALVSQYESFEPLPGRRVNGRLTLGENIGDLSGLTMAYRAWRLSLGADEAALIDGLTGDQRFFHGWSQIWRRKIRDSELERRLIVDPHAPSRYRVNGVLRNMDAFHEAFGVQAGDGMYLPPDERVRIW